MRAKTSSDTSFRVKCSACGWAGYRRARVAAEVVPSSCPQCGHHWPEVVGKRKARAVGPSSVPDPIEDFYHAAGVIEREPVLRRPPTPYELRRFPSKRLGAPA